MNQADYVKRNKPSLDRKVSFEPALVAYSYDNMGIFMRASHVMPVVHGKGISYELPIQHTLVAPPPVPEGHVAVYAQSTGAWHVLEDHRGEVWRDFGGRPVDVARPGNPHHWGLNR